MQERVQAAREQDLTATERGMIATVLEGREADLGGDSVRAAVVADLLLGRLPTSALGAQGVRLCNGGLRGCLTLSDGRLPFPLMLRDIAVLDCLGGVALDFTRCRVVDIVLERMTVSGADETGRSVAAAGLHASGSLEVRDCHFAGAVQLDRARVDGDLVLAGSRFGDGSSGFEAAHLRSGGCLDISGCTISGRTAIAGADVSQSLIAHGASIAVGAGAVALDLDGARIGRDVNLENTRIDGSVIAADFRVTGRLGAHKLAVTAVGGGVLTSGLIVGGDVEFDEAEIKGRVCLDGASIGGGLSMQRCLVDGGDVALSANGLAVVRDWLMTGSKLIGQVRCPRANIGGDMRLARVRVFGSEAAVTAPDAEIGGALDFGRATVVGLIALERAAVVGGTSFDAATIKVERGSAIDARSARLSGGVRFGGGMQTIGAVRFDDSVVHGGLTFAGAHLKSVAIARGGGAAAGTVVHSPDDAIVLSLSGARLDRLTMPAAAEQRPRGIVDLSNARAALFEDFSETWPDPAERQSAGAERAADFVVLGGFSYGRLVNPDGRAAGPGPLRRRDGSVAARRISWLRSIAQAGRRAGNADRAVPASDTTSDLAQLARCLAAQGLAQDAALVDLERRQVSRRQWPQFSGRRMASWLVDATTAYGLRPARALILLFFMLAAFTGVWSWAASQCAEAGCRDQSVFVRVPGAVSPSATPASFHALSHGFDRLLPPLAIGASGRWRANVAYGPLASFTLPNVPLFVSGETQKAKLYTTISITTGGILAVLEVLSSIIGLTLTGLALVAFMGGFGGRLGSRLRHDYPGADG